MFEIPYPVILVHGLCVSAATEKRLWGRIGKTFEDAGFVVRYSSQDSCGKLTENIKQLIARIDNVLDETKCAKVHLVCHSKGGLEARAAAYDPQLLGRIASITMISSPHGGSETAEKLLRKNSLLLSCVSHIWNFAARIGGDLKPDILESLRDLLPSSMHTFNEKYPDRSEIVYQNYTTYLVHAADWRLRIPFRYIRRFEGKNDGIVALWSSQLPQYSQPLPAPEGRGLSHHEVIDLSRRPIPLKDGKFYDICTFYKEIAENIKKLES